MNLKKEKGLFMLSNCIFSSFQIRLTSYCSWKKHYLSTGLHTDPVCTVFLVSARIRYFMPLSHFPQCSWSWNDYCRNKACMKCTHRTTGSMHTKLKNCTSIFCRNNIYPNHFKVLHSNKNNGCLTHFINS